MKKLILKNEKYITEYFNEETGTYSFTVKVPFYDQNHKRKQKCKTFNSKDYFNPKQALEEAKNFRNTFLIEINEKHVINTEIITFGAVFEEVQENYPNSAETKRKEVLTYNKYMMQNFQDENIKEIKLYEVKQFLNNLSYSATESILKQIVKIFRKVFSYAIEKEYIENDFSYQIKKPKSKIITKTREVDINDDDLQKILNYLIQSTNKRDQQIAKMIILGEITGFRPSEIYGLQKRNISLKQAKIKLEQAVTINQNRKSEIIGLKTENSYREFPILDDYLPFFKKLIQDKNNSDFIFLDYNNEPFNNNVVCTRLRTISKKINVPFRMYMLRHKFSTNILLNGGDLRTIQELMGHSDSTTTLSYARSNVIKKIETLEKVENISIKSIEIL